MSRSTHDIECNDCGYKGKVVDDSIVCPKCGMSVEGQPITGAVLAAMIAKIKSKQEAAAASLRSTEIKG
jgi:anaerobic ribonucleoside-triphosphate reductase